MANVLPTLEFPRHHRWKIEASVFDGPQIRTLFVSEMKNVECKAWESFKAVTTNFSGDRKSSNYKSNVSSIVINIEKLECMMNL